MLEVVANLFTRRDPRREARLGLARIISRYDMTCLSYEQGITVERRDRDERHVALGVWLFPCKATAKAADLNIASGVPAVTHDLRSDGFGVMTPVSLKHKHFFVAVPDETDCWRFFKCDVRHNSVKPGNWYLLGLQVDVSILLDGKQRIRFRDHIGEICGAE